MIPILFRNSETAFTSNGICRLIDCISCEVTEERNGVYELEMTYPVTGRNYSKIARGLIIYATHDDTQTPQPFDIYKISKPIDGIVTINASHISYRQNKMVLKPFTAVDIQTALQGFVTYCQTNNPFTYWTDKEPATSAPYDLKEPKTVRAALGGSEGSILDVYGTGEYEFDHFSVKLYAERGEVKPVQIRYGKNMTDLTDEDDAGDVYNAVMPFWRSPETGFVSILPELTVGRDGVLFFDEPWTTTTGTITDENGTEIDFRYAPSAVIPLDLSGDFPTPPTFQQMRSRAAQLLNQNKPWLSRRTITVDFVQLWQMDEYKDVAPLQHVNLCDTVTIVHPYLDLTAEAKIVKTVYDTLLERYNSMELGDAKATFGTMITDSATKSATEGVAAAVSAAATGIVNTLTGENGGHVVIKYTNGVPNEILIMDTDNIETASNVWKWDYKGLSHSSNGYYGDYADASILMDGTINANAIKTGTIQSRTDGSTYWNLDTGDFANFTNERGVRLQNGYADFYIPQLSTIVGRIGALLYTGAGAENTYTLGITAHSPGLALGYKASGSSAVTIAMMINNGINLYGMEEALHLYSRTKTLSSIGFAIRHTPNYDGDVLHYDGGEIQAVYSNDVNHTTLRIKGAGGGVLFTDKDNNWALHIDDGSAYQARATHIYKLCVGAIMQPLSAYAARMTSLYVNTEISCDNLVQRSDERDKNIKEWDDRYLDVLDDIEPILYTWKGSEEPHIGYSAQRVQKALDKHGVSGFVRDAEGHLALNYQELAVLLHAKVKRQQEEITSLTERLTRAERTIEKLCESLSYQQ